MDIGIIRFHTTIFYFFALSWDFEEDPNIGCMVEGGGVGGGIEVDVVVLKDKVRLEVNKHSHNNIIIQS